MTDPDVLRIVVVTPRPMPTGSARCYSVLGSLSFTFPESEASLPVLHCLESSTTDSYAAHQAAIAAVDKRQDFLREPSMFLHCPDEDMSITMEHVGGTIPANTVRGLLPKTTWRALKDTTITIVVVLAKAVETKDADEPAAKRRRVEDTVCTPLPPVSPTENDKSSVRNMTPESARLASTDGKKSASWGLLASTHSVPTEDMTDEMCIFVDRVRDMLASYLDNSKVDPLIARATRISLVSVPDKQLYGVYFADVCWGFSSETKGCRWTLGRCRCALSGSQLVNKFKELTQRAFFSSYFLARSVSSSTQTDDPADA